MIFTKQIKDDLNVWNNKTIVGKIWIVSKVIIKVSFGYAILSLYIHIGGVC